MSREEQQFQKRMCELARRSYMENRYCYTGFLNESEQSLLLQLEGELPIKVALFGGSPASERRLAIFGDETLFGYAAIPPVAFLHIMPAAKKFADNLTHRDVLGAVMHLGMEREMIGDIFVRDKEVYLFCMEQMQEYIVKELAKIRHTIVRVEPVPIEQAEELTLAEGKEMEILTASLRLDAVVAAAFKLSRQESQLLIRERKVFTAGRLNENNSGLLKEPVMVSVRGKGRFFYTGIAYETKKGRFRIVIKQYCS